MKKLLLINLMILTACSQTEPTTTIVSQALIVSPSSTATPTKVPQTSTFTPIPIGTPTPLPTTPSPTSTITSLPAPTATEKPAQPIVLENEERQEVFDNFPQANLWIPDGNQMRLLNIDNIEFRRTDGDIFIRGYENERLVLLTEPSTARPEWKTYGVSGINQGRVFEKIITAYQLNTPD